MADIAINPVSRRVQFTGNTGTGPFAFTFNILADEDIAVYKNTTLLTLTTDYTVSTNADGTGSITLVSALIASDVLTIIGGRELERTTDFVTAGDLLASSLNEQLDSLVIMAQQLDEKLSRSVKVNPGDVFTDLELPGKDARKGTVLGFNATSGDPEAGPKIADVGTLAAITQDISTLADIEDGTDATDAIQTAASISSDISTVSGISSDVSTVAGVQNNVGLVANSISNVNTVATNINRVDTVSTNISDVTTVADDLNEAVSEINTVASNLNGSNTIGTVATNIASVNTVATNIADVITVANDLNEAVSEVVTVADDLNEAVSEIDTVASSISNVDTVGTNISNVNTVAGISSDVTTVAGISANTTTVAGISANVTTVAGISSNVTAVANDATDIGTVAGISANVTTVAGLSSSVSTLALISSDITTVAGISANVTTVAGDTANIATIATNLNGTDTIGTVAGSISNVNSVGSAIADVSTVASNLTDIQSFANTYRIGATDPTTSLDTGDLFYNTTSSTLKVYTGSAWEQGVTAGSGFLPLTGGGLTGDLTFGDNNKATFGAGSDLSIFSNGTDSFIQEYTTGGHLYIDGTNVRIRNRSDNTLRLQTSDSGAVDLYHSGSSKLTTTSTGIDVTGTVTADGLTVNTNTLNGEATFYDTNTATVYLQNSVSGTTATDGLSIALSNEIAYINNREAGDLRLYTNNSESMRIASNGDISFYEDTGTTPKFFWDASAEGLSLGTTDNPNGSPLYIRCATDDNIRIQQETHASIQAVNDAANAFTELKLDGSSLLLNSQSGGNVGIGNTVQSSMVGTASMTIGTGLGGQAAVHTIYTNPNTYGALYFADATSGAARYQGGLEYSHPDDALKFLTSTNERMRINSSGTVLVGKTADNLTDAGQVFSTAGSSFTRSGGAVCQFNRNTSDGEIVRLSKDGTTVGSIASRGGVGVQINSQSGDGALAKGGTEYIYWGDTGLYPATTNTRTIGTASYKFSDGHFGGTVNAANFNTTSDATLKTNVETLTGSLDAVKALRGVSFDWIDSGNSEVGVIAQEVEAVVPDVVSTDDQGIKSVKYGNLVGVLIEAIKEQQAQIDELKAKLGD